MPTLKYTTHYIQYIRFAVCLSNTPYDQIIKVMNVVQTQQILLYSIKRWVQENKFEALMYPASSEKKDLNKKKFIAS